MSCLSDFSYCSWDSQGKNAEVVSIPFSSGSHSVSYFTCNTEEAEVEQFSEELQDLLELTPKKDVLFIIGDWNAKVGSQETPGVTAKFGLGL